MMTHRKFRNNNYKIKIISILILIFAFIVFTFNYFQKDFNNKPVATEADKKNDIIETPNKANNLKVSRSQIEEKIFGKSASGKDIKGYTVGNGEDVTLLFGGIHGNEMGTVDLLYTLIKYLSENEDIISSQKKLVIIPCINPDGYYDRTDKLNSNDVNLNLNFSTSDWSMYGKEGQFAGIEPWSEPESRLLKYIVEIYQPDRMISYHSNGSITNPEATEESRELAWWYGVETGYTYFNDPDWDYSGTATKWFVETYSKPAITVELNDHYSNDWEQNRSAILQLIK